jgi:predicted DNA-binding protein (MmcQ/YjbR family)
MNKHFKKLDEIARAWPGAECSVSGTHATFRVKGRPFAYFLDDHHGDGIVSVCTKTELGENEELARREPGRFYLPAHIGKRGWVAVRLDVGRIRWSEVATLIERSYRLSSGAKSSSSVSARRTNRPKAGPTPASRKTTRYAGP